MSGTMANILVIEDEPELRDLIVCELEDFGHKTMEAKDGAEGLEKILAGNPDLILSDIQMPVMSGHQLRGALKKNHPEHAKIPFVFLTALADQADMADGLVLGVDHYFTKPINFDLLHGWIKDTARKR